MGNLSYKLESLFRQYLIRKEKETSIPVYNYSYSGGYCRQNEWLNNHETYDGVIYFYELSDTNRAPQLFYNVGAFDLFLRKYAIYMPPFQKDIIRQLDRAYVTCKKGTHDLLIRATRPMLLDAVADSNASGVDLQTAGAAVMNTPPTPAAPVGLGHNPMGMMYQGERKPPMYSGYPGEWY